MVACHVTCRYGMCLKVRWNDCDLNRWRKKGGVGRGAACDPSGLVLARHGRDPLLIDADPQGSTTNFTELGTNAMRRRGSPASRNSGKALPMTSVRLPGDTQTSSSTLAGATPSSSGLLCLSRNGSWCLSTARPSIGGRSKRSISLRARPSSQTPTCKHRCCSIVRPATRSCVGARSQPRTNVLRQLRSLTSTSLGCFLVERTAFQDDEEFGLTVWEPSVLRGTVDPMACDELANLYQEIFAHEFAIGPSALKAAPDP